MSSPDQKDARLTANSQAIGKSAMIEGILKLREKIEKQGLKIPERGAKGKSSTFA